MVGVNCKEMCCGCSACKAICPLNCVEMVMDEEGFLYPNIDKEKCINCGLCEKVCPILNLPPKSECQQVGYTVQHINNKIVQESTSGGAFTAIAEYVISKGGYVFGACLDFDMNVKHIGISSVSEVCLFRNSKYVQSKIDSKIYIEVKELLNRGIIVCFSGTPCQIAAIKGYLQKDYDNLITVDIVCRAVPSPMIFKKYLEYQEGRMNAHIKSVRFRDKKYGYNFSTLRIVTESEKKYNYGIESDPWLRAFFSNICSRPSCHDCKFRNMHRDSDITLWDCFQVSTYAPELGDGGATNLLIHTVKGKVVFEAIKTNIRFVKRDLEELVNGTAEFLKSIPKASNRTEFFLDANIMDGNQLFGKYFPFDWKAKFRFYMRFILVKLNMYTRLKRVIKRIVKVE